MSKSLSLDICERIASAVQLAEESHVLIAARFSISVSTVERISRKLREGRTLEPAPRLGRTKVLMENHRAFIRHQLRDDPYITSYELARRFNARFRVNRVHRSTILRAMRELGFSFKKKRPTPPSETDQT